MVDRTAPSAPVEEDARPGISQRPLFVFGVCLSGWTLAQMDLAFFGFVVPQITEEFGIGTAAIGLILAVVSIFTGLGVVFWGYLADRVGRKPIFQITILLYAVFTFLQGLAPNAWFLAASRSLANASSGGEAPITNTLVAESAPPRWRGVMVGLLQTGYPLGWFVASLITVPVVAAYGWRAVFFVGIVPALFVFVVRLAVRESSRFEEVKAVREHQMSAGQTRAVDSEERARRNGLGELFSPELRRTTVSLFVMTLMWAGAYGGSAFFLPTFLIETKGFDFATATYLVGIAYAIGALGYVLSAFVGEFVLTRRNTGVIWLWLGAIGFFGLTWFSGSYASVFLWFSFMVIFFYGFAAIQGALVTESFPTRIRTTGAGTAGSLGVALGLGVFPLVTGVMIPTIGWNATFTAFVVVPLLLSGIALLFTRNVRSGVDLEEIAV